jgi:hypothetical protein
MDGVSGDDEQLAAIGASQIDRRRVMPTREIRCRENVVEIAT